MKTVILVSGGIDSTIMASRYDGLKVFCDIGQPYALEELIALESLFGAGNFECLEIGLNLSKEIFIPNRNLLLCCLVSAKYNPDTIMLAGLKDDNVSDKNPEAFKKMSLILSEFANKKVTVMSPYFKTTKGELVQGFTDRELLQKTFSCYFPINGEECADCDACLRKYVALYSNNIPVNQITKRIAYKYLKKLHTYCQDRISRTLISYKPIFGTINAIDIDGTLNHEANHFNYRKARAKLSAITKSNQLEGLKILYTARLESDRKLTEEWLEKNGVEYDALIMNKLPFDILYDDKTKKTL